MIRLGQYRTAHSKRRPVPVGQYRAARRAIPESGGRDRSAIRYRSVPDRMCLPYTLPGTSIASVSTDGGTACIIAHRPRVSVRYIASVPSPAHISTAYTSTQQYASVLDSA
eukprot:2813841-Rhodomonas_salina.2